MNILLRGGNTIDRSLSKNTAFNIYSSKFVRLQGKYCFKIASNLKFVNSLQIFPSSIYRVLAFFVALIHGNSIIYFWIQGDPTVQCALCRKHEAKGPEAAPLDFLFYQMLQGTGGSRDSQARSDKTKSRSWVQQDSVEGDTCPQNISFRSPAWKDFAGASKWSVYFENIEMLGNCLLYTSDAADE